MKAANGLRFGETYINREHFEAMQGFHAGRRKSGSGGADGRYGLNEHVETQGCICRCTAGQMGLRHKGLQLFILSRFG